MALTGYEVPVFLKLPGVRTVGTVVGEAYALDTNAENVDRLALGVKWNAPNCDGIEVSDSDCDTTAALPNPLVSGLTEGEQPAFSLWDAVQCSALSRTNDLMKAVVGWRMDALGSAAIAAELISGTASGGIGLTDGTALAAGAETGAAISLVEQGLAGLMGNGLGVVHFAVQHLSDAIQFGAVERVEGGGFRTSLGHTVIVDGGYPTGTVWGSGPIGLSASAVKFLSGPEGQFVIGEGDTISDFRNVVQHLASQYAVLAFNPCLVVKSAITA